MIKAELQSILDAVNNSDYSNFIEYQNINRLLVEKLSQLTKEDKSPILDAWLNMGLIEIRKEVEKLNNFQNLMPDKQRVEFMYSKSTISMSLTNIIMHL